jgi:3',5'-cyclic AMP phosphodiesterase CpdA
MIENDGVDGKKHERKDYHSEYPHPSHFLIHISDTHLLRDSSGLYGSNVYPDANFRYLINQLEKSELKPDAIILTGDIADMGHSKAYRKIKRMLDPIKERLGCEIIWVMGNHDDRRSFRKELLGEEEPSRDTVDEVFMVNGLRIIALDTTVEGAHWGAISKKQLRWLESVLATEAPNGTILAMHHPPVPSVIESAVSVELEKQYRLAEVLEGTDVRSIIAGHLHYSTMSMFAGIPVSVASATCYVQKLDIPEGSLKAINGGQAYNFVHVYPTTIAHSVVPLQEAPAIKTLTAAQIEAELRADGFVGFPTGSISIVKAEDEED